MKTQEKIQKIVNYVNECGGASQFHYLGDLFLSTFDKNYNLSNNITEVSRGRKKNIEITDQLADQILEQIRLSDIERAKYK